ncbi:hypothetical protein HDZ31DRAFT_43570, partial [Schizophyllum fasciatum]
QVDEATVLTDPTGMHIGAGPCMLFYSRSVTDEERWDMEHCRYHEHFMNNVLQCNAQYFEKLPDDVKARIETTWGSADAFVRRGMPPQALSASSHPMSPSARPASPSTAMNVDLTPRGPRPEKATHAATPSHASTSSHTSSSSIHRNTLRKSSTATRDTVMRDPPLQHRDASAREVRDVPPHQGREARDLPPHQPLPREGSLSRVEGPHGPREASMGRSSPSLSRDASMSNP